MYINRKDRPLRRQRNEGRIPPVLEEREFYSPELRDIVFRIGHSETLYHRPDVETGPPEGKNFTADFSIRREEARRDLQKVPGKKL